ncbi:hypothetical protein DPMN_053790 [Dreissena polymorpha]|uniref:Uncharacterized protein n=1 Tax=Dreissena polymorpha TaxID=45954 RepID=A0A9D4CM16_DREPO|nr:hypothetical protein DPMN_053790 [Dreissena polymorpha]
MELFKEKVCEFEKRLDIKETKVLSYLSHDIASANIRKIKEIETPLKSELASYEATAAIYIQYLNASKFHESEQYKSSFQEHLNKLQSEVATYLNQIDIRKQTIFEDIVFTSIHSSRGDKAASMKQSLKKEDELKKEKTRLELALKEINAGLNVLHLGKNKGTQNCESERTATVDGISLPDLTQEEMINTFFDTCNRPATVVSTNVHQELSNFILKQKNYFQE